MNGVGLFCVGKFKLGVVVWEADRFCISFTAFESSHAQCWEEESGDEGEKNWVESHDDNPV